MHRSGSSIIAATLSAVVLGACVTINIYFPAAAAERAADRIIDEIWQVSPDSVKPPAGKSDPAKSPAGKPSAAGSPAGKTDAAGSPAGKSNAAGSPAQKQQQPAAAQ